MSVDRPHPLSLRLFAAAAIIGVVGWVALFALAGWWLLQPTNLPTVTEPIEVVNPGNEVAIGEPLVMRLEVDKPAQATATSSSRRLECVSGNLVTLTDGSAVPLPVGSYTLVSDNVILPAKVTVGDVCEAVWTIRYQINPIRSELLEWRSEPFTVMEATT